MIVLDSSAAASIVRETDQGNALRRLMLMDEKIVASDMFHAEIRNTFWKYVRASIMTEDDAKLRIEMAEGIVDEFIPLEENAKEAFVMSCQYDHPVYDMFYLSLARRHDATLCTLDRRLMDIARRAQVNCMELVDL